GFVGECMQPAMDVGVRAAHGGGHGFDHGLRLLRTGGAVEIDERPAVHFPTEDGEFGADGVDVEWTFDDRRVHAAPPASQARIRSTNSLWIASGNPSGRASTRKLSISSARASFSGTP